jgi:hypothetical protein
VVDREDIERERQDADDGEEGLAEARSKRGSLHRRRGITNDEELRGAVFLDGLHAETDHLLGGGICKFNTGCDRDHQGDYAACGPRLRERASGVARMSPGTWSGLEKRRERN